MIGSSTSAETGDDLSWRYSKMLGNGVQFGDNFRMHGIGGHMRRNLPIIGEIMQAAACKTGEIILVFALVFSK